MNLNIKEQEELLKSLSEEERELALQILKEYGEEGSSETYDKLLYEDYKERPVDIETFLKDDNYMGQAWKDAEGNFKMYPYWFDIMKQIFPNNIDTNYDILLETGARGLGKSEIACAAIAPYLMYRIMCMKNPQETYNMKTSDSIFFAFVNIKLSSAEKIAITKFQKNIQMSPWFMSKGKMTSFKNSPYWLPPEPIEIIIGSQSDDLVGKNIFYAFFDEISFIRNQDIEVQKERARDMIDTAVAGMKTRFIFRGHNPTLLCVASSKRSEQSFMEQYVQLITEAEGQSALIVDKPVWEIKPDNTYSGRKFLIGVGNKQLDSIIIPETDYEHLDFYKEKGFKIIEVPVELKSEFKKDLERSLCDYAGISSTNANKYFSASVVKDCINPEYKNPFPDIIEVGNDKNDVLQYKDFFNMDNIPQDLMTKPMCVHMDLSTSGDMTGIAGMWIVGKKASNEENSGKDLMFRLAFSVSIKAPKGKQISYEKNRKFIRWLRETGFNLKMISTDSFQSTDTLQQLSAEGFNTKVISVDRVDKTEKNPICRPYAYLYSTVYERRLSMYKCDRLFDEFTDVERNLNNGKVDHTRNGHKDMLDAVCGSMYASIDLADEYAYDYGETYETMFDVNEKDSHDTKEQLVVDFEQELMSLRHPLTNKEIGNAPEVGKGKVVGGIDKEAQERMRQEYLKRKQQEEENFLISSNYDDSMIVF